MTLSVKGSSKEFLVKVIVKNFINKEICGKCKTKEWKKLDHKTKLVEELNKNIRQPSFKALVLALCYYCGDNVKYGLLSKKLFQRKEKHDSWENFSYNKPSSRTMTSSACIRIKNIHWSKLYQ